MRTGPTLLLVVLASACAGPPPHQPTGCNPLGDDACLLPFPSSYFQVDDKASPTGVRNAVPAGVLPVNAAGIALRPDPFNRLDGWSPATPLVLYFRDGVDASQLPGPRDLGSSLAADAAVQLFDMSIGERVPYFAELDANAGPDQRQALLVRPQRRLAPGTRHAVAIRGLLSASGEPLPAPAAFVEARDKRLDSHSALYTMGPRYEELFSFLAQHGLPRGELLLAWDFVTASDEGIVGPMVRMRDRALADAPGTYRVTEVLEDPANLHVLREVRGTFDVPAFIAGAGTKLALRRDEAGEPAPDGVLAATFVVQIPRCAASATRPLPLLVFGHGLFLSAQDEMDNDVQEKAIDRMCMVEVGTNWTGLSRPDLIPIVDVVLSNFNHFNLITDQLMQAHLNVQVLSRLARAQMKDDPAMAVGGKPVISGDEVYYYGSSLGAIQGTTFLALSPDVARAGLNVGGAEWSLMINRSGNLSLLQVVLDTHQPDKVDQQELIALTQSLFDPTDPISYAPHLLANPLAGSGTKRFVLQESIGDAEVPNFATRILARTMGVPALAPLVQAVDGLEQQGGPLDAAYTQYDVHPLPLPPDTNVPAADNAAHDGVAPLEASVKQIEALLRPTGRVEQFCAGSCDPE